MPSVDELLNAAEVAVNELETNDIIVIDADTRTMIIPDTERIFGVMSDEKGERKYFICKRFVGNGIDLSKLSLRIVFQNASGLDTGKDKYIVTDLAADGEKYVTFSWELSRKVTEYKGIISFIVCAIKTKSDGTITNEWNTTLANGIVLEGLEANGTQEQEQVARDYYNQLEAELLRVANEQKTEIEKKAQEVIETIPSDYTELTNDVNQLKEDSSYYSKRFFDLKKELINNKLISSKNGWAEDASDYKSTNFIPVNAGSIIAYNLIGGDEAIAVLSFYTNKDWKTFDTVNVVKGGATKNGLFTVPSNGYIRVCCGVKFLKYCFIYFKDSEISYYPINVKNYGAVGDGITDDTIAIKNAVKSNYVVYFPNGEYVVSDTILLQSKHKIIGEQRHNTIIKYVGDNTDVFMAVVSSKDGSYDCVVESISINGGGKCVGVYLQATSEEKLERYDTHGIIKDCDIKNVTYGVRIGGKCRGSFLKNLYIKDCSRHAIYIQGTDNFIIECVGIQIQWSGVYLQSANNVVRNCRMGLCNKANNENAGYLVESINNSLIGCTAQQNYRNALVINNTSRCLIESFQSDWNNAGKVNGYDTAHIKILNSSFCKLSGIIIDGETDGAYSVYGIFLEGSTKKNVFDFVVAKNEQSDFVECNVAMNSLLAQNNKIIINGDRWGIN